MANPAALVGRWGVPALWVSLPLTAGPTLASALDATSTTFRDVCAVMLWAGWTAVLAAALVPRVSTLTAVRIAVPASLLTCIWATASVDHRGAAEVVAITITAAVTVVALSAATGFAYVNGSAYGPERRYPLRPPGVLLVGVLELVWLVVVAGAVTGPLLFAASAPVGGALALVVGWPVAVLGTRSLHLLSTRWLVFTLAGMVVVDRLALTDTLLAPKGALAAVGPAPADADAVDLTVGALGLALCLTFREPQAVTTAPPRRDRTSPRARECTAVLVAPTRPGAVLAEAERRRLPVQRAMPPPTTTSPS